MTRFERAVLWIIGTTLVLGVVTVELTHSYGAGCLVLLSTPFSIWMASRLT